MNNKNTSEYLPFDCISPNLLVNPDYLDYPYLSGTGFFCFFPPYEYLFYVTARHCLLKDNENEIYEYLKIPYSNQTSKEPPLAVVFSQILSTKEDEKTEGFEDLLVLVVDIEKNKNEYNILRKRAIALSHQEDIDETIKLLCKENGNIRTLGFSQPNTPQADKHTEIIYGDKENRQLVMKPRGYYGKIKNNSSFNHRYGFEETNWDEKEYRGFSGSPVISLVQSPFTNSPVMRVIGLMLTATKSRGEFLSINIATNLIASYIISINKPA